MLKTDLEKERERERKLREWILEVEILRGFP